MSERFTKLENKVDKIDERVDKISETLIRNTDLLEEHHKRSTYLEKYTTTLEEKLIEELHPIKLHVNRVTYGFKAIMWFCAGIMGLAGFIKILIELRIL